jgi:hypothetical protein
LISGSSKHFTTAGSTPYSSPIFSAVSTPEARTRSKSSFVRKKTSRVIQNGPGI